MNPHIAVRNQALRRLRRITRTVTASAVAGAGMLAIVVARVAPGRHPVRITSVAPVAPAITAAPATTVPATTVPATASTDVPPGPAAQAVPPPALTSPPATVRPLHRAKPPVPTTAPAVVTSGAS